MSSDFANEVHNLLLRITPERKDQLEKLLAGVTFRQNDHSERIEFSASTNLKLVIVPMRCQFRLWAHCFAYFCAFAAFDAKRQGQSTKARFGLSEQELQTAGDLLEWAVRTDVNLRQSTTSQLLFDVSKLPADLPKLFEGQSPSKLHPIAANVFLNAVAFIIHHELAHVQLGHSGTEGDVSISEEYEADRTAANWLLSHKSKNNSDYLVRHIGVASALMWFVSIYFREKHESTTHPPAWNRLLKALEPSVRKETDPIWGFVAIALSLHFHRYGIPLEALSDFAPTKTNVREMIAEIEKFNDKIGQA